MELEIFIHDEYWKREPKSLSWWQKVLLQIVWIISISQILWTSFLFLDETINNLDIDTIQKVSVLLRDYILGKKKFYMVTHAPEIQNMDIWDWIIEL
jgi:DNA repair exonuclease SbcCD ATPase subunit